MVFHTASLAPTMLNLERLPMDESNSLHIELLPLVENSRLGKKVLSLESVMEFCDDTYTDIDEVVHKVANRYHLNESDIAFSVEPYSVYFDIDVNNMVQSFIENDIPFYLDGKMGSIEGQLISELCTYAERSGDVDVLDVLNELQFFDNIKNSLSAAKSGAVSGAMKGAVNVGGSFIKGAAGAAARGLKAGAIHGAEDFANNRLFGKLDTTDSNGKTVRNGKVAEFMQQHISSNPEAINFANSMVNQLRSNVSEDIVHRAARLLGVAGDKINPQNLINGLTQRASYFKNRIMNGKGDPQQRSVFQRILDKLIELKNKLIARLRGQPSPT